MSVIEKIVNLFDEQGRNAYLGESITQLEHAIQTALAAKKYQARSEMIAAALLHDIGHLLCENASSKSAHEKVGAAFLAHHFKPSVVELVAQHVNAKRYLTATNKKYLNTLSEASFKSLQLQGGPMRENEVNAFAARPLLNDIILIRYWDEGAKIPNKQLPPITDFLDDLKAVLK